jgi:hypothetical protein
LIGPRQVGKTTLALEVAAMRPSVYLDLEDPAARARLADPALYFESHADDLVILDELQRVPELFALLRGIIDRGRRQGRRTGRFLLLGSASLALLRQASESLAGRIAQVELAPLDVTELGGRRSVSARWLRGGFPDSLLAADDGDSLDWRRDFLRTYLERDIPQLAPRVPTETLRRLWTMLAHEQGGVLNAARLAAGLGLSGQTIARYVDLLVDLMLVRRLPPLIANVGKRQVKGPRVYVRDSGLVHALLGIATLDDLLGHPIVGPSWEGFVIEQLIDNAAPGSAAGFYRTSAGAEIDLVIERPGGRRWAIEVKRSLGPSVTRGFHSARADLEVERAFVVYAGDERYPLADGVEVIGLAAMIEELRVS